MPSNGLFYDPPKCDVIMSVGPQLPTPMGGSRPKRAPLKVTEDATWAGVRDTAHSYGFAAFDVDPASGPGRTSINVTFFNTAPSATGDPSVLERITLTRPIRYEAGDETESAQRAETSNSSR